MLDETKPRYKDIAEAHRLYRQRNYAFGIITGDDLKRAYNHHQAVCPFCKSEGNRLDLITDRMECHVSFCRGKWEPQKATKKNLERFMTFMLMDNRKVSIKV